MLAQLCLWAACLIPAQEAPESAWLKVAPASADVVIHLRNVEAVKTDLSAMIKAMSPALGEQAGPAMDQGVEQFTAIFGKAAARSPMLVVARGVVPDAPGSFPVAVILSVDDYAGLIKAVAGAGGGDGKTKATEDGIDTFDGPQGSTWYAFKGQGFVTLGPDKSLVSAIAKPGAETLAATISAPLQTQLMAGDLGVYVNTASLRKRYADQIAQARQTFMALLDQAGQQQGNAQMMDAAKGVYGGLFDAIDVADGLAFDFDFAAEGLGIEGALALKSDSGAAKTLSGMKGGDASDLAKLPADSSYYVFMDVDPKAFGRFQQMGLSMLAGQEKDKEKLAALMKLQEQAGRIRTVGATSIGDGMRAINVMKADDPAKLAEATIGTASAMKGTALGGMDVIKDVKITKDAETYKGFTFTKTSVTFDLEKMAKAQPNPAGVEAFKGMFGGDTLNTWVGTDGKTVVSLVGKDFDSAKAQLDSYMSGQDGIGGTAGYKTVRKMLPSDGNFLLLISMQGLVKQMAGQFRAMFNNPDLKPPGDMPKEPAFVGLSVGANGPVMKFHVAVPSPVGAVIEKGLVPLFQGLQGRVN